MRILHVLGAMNQGGIEAWLMHVLRNIDKSKYQIDFLVHKKEKALFDDEINLLGSSIYRIPGFGNPLSYGWRLFRFLRKNKFDVVHSHVHNFSGIVLLVATLAGVKIRVAHSHTDTRRNAISLPRKIYELMMRILISLFSTKGVAVSNNAALSLFGKNWDKREKYSIVYCGVDLRAFHEKYDREKFKRELGIKKENKIIGHVGRIEKAKNHIFLIGIFEKLLIQQKNALLLMVGDGSLRKSLEKEVAKRNLTDKVIFLGARSDVPKILQIMDAFVFPSLWEGLPLTLIEAQAAGHKCIVSDSITDEVNLLGCHYISLSAQLGEWINAIEDELKNPRNEGAIEIVEKSSFSIDASIENMLNVYR